MDKKQLDNIFTSSVMAKMNEIQRQVDPFHQIRSSSKIPEIIEQNARISSAVSIGEMARKAFEQQNLASTNVAALSASASILQSQTREAVALQDSFRKIVEGLNLGGNTRLAAENTMKSIYKDTVVSIDQLRETLEPWRGSFSGAGKTFNGSEFANLVREMQTSRVIPESTFSEFASIVEQLEPLKNLESFKAVSRLKNFPNDKVWKQNYDKKHEVTEDFLVEVRKIDRRIDDEVSSVNNFNDSSENSQRSLEKLNLNYYQLLIINYIYYMTILKDKISNSFKYSNMEFRFVGLSSKVLVGVCFISFQPDFNSICNSILASILLENIRQDKKR